MAEAIPDYENYAWEADVEEIRELEDNYISASNNLVKAMDKVRVALARVGFDVWLSKWYKFGLFLLPRSGQRRIYEWRGTSILKKNGYKESYKLPFED